mmetsp:Transcript_28840/g.68707  ORF Transcript_28840/g.68707 Transcript_28840/m.68707 type:complete len:211 (+) Transcript_28840:1815-2447(+)
MSLTFCLTITPCEVVRRTSSSSCTTCIELTLSSIRFALNLMAITPLPPRAVVLNSSVFTRLPCPSMVTMRSASSPIPSRMFTSAIVSPFLSVKALTPLLVRPVALRSAAANLVACPLVDPTRMSSLFVHLSHQFSLSPSPREAMIKPLDVRFSNALSEVFLIQPFFVARTMNWSFENSETGKTDVMTSPALIGSTDGMGAPLAVRPPSGT